MLKLKIKTMMMKMRKRFRRKVTLKKLVVKPAKRVKLKTMNRTRLRTTQKNSYKLWRMYNKNKHPRKASVEKIKNLKRVSQAMEYLQ